MHYDVTRMTLTYDTMTDDEKRRKKRKRMRKKGRNVFTGTCQNLNEKDLKDALLSLSFSTSTKF